MFIGLTRWTYIQRYDFLGYICVGADVSEEYMPPPCSGSKHRWTSVRLHFSTCQKIELFTVITSNMWLSTYIRGRTKENHGHSSAVDILAGYRPETMPTEPDCSVQRSDNVERASDPGSKNNRVVTVVLFITITVYHYSLYNGRKTYFTLNLGWQDGCRLFKPLIAQPALALWNFALAEIKKKKK